MDQNKMGTQPIPKLLITMSLPMIIAMMVQAAYNVVDRLFVARLGEEALRSVSLAFPVQLIIVAAFVGLGVGINSNISRKLGEKDVKNATLVAEHGYLAGLFLYVIVALVGVFTVRGFFENYSDNANVINQAVIYIHIVLIFSFGRIFAQTGMSVLQGTGEMVKPMIAQLIGAVLNIALDPIFIFGFGFIPAMGVKGAAVATVSGQIVSMFVTIIFIFKTNSILKLNLKEFKFRSHIMTDIVSVGLPATIMQGLGSIMVAGFNLILAPISQTAITIFGIYFSVQSFVFMPVFGLSTGTLPIIGYNYGAKDFKRLSEAIKYALMMAIGYFIVGFAVFQLYPQGLLKLFNSTEEMMTIGVHAFRCISLIFPLVGISIILSTAFQAFGKAYYSMVVSIVRQLVVLLPAAFILAKQFGLSGVWYAFVMAEIVGAIVVIPLFLKVYRNSVAAASSKGSSATLVSDEV